MNDSTDLCCNQLEELKVDFDQINHNEKRTLWVVILTTAMMVIEIVAGYVTGSMALLADGYHMASHAGALGIAYLVYRLARSPKIARQLSFGSGKLLPLGGYTSAVGLGIIALWMIAESVHRLLNPIDIQFKEAIAITVVGLAVNVLSAFILGGHSHHHHDENPDHVFDLHQNYDHEHHQHGHDHDHVHDHNHKSALVHVIADAFTSVLAIIALSVGSYFNSSWLDPVMGIVGALVILRWAYTLCKSTAKELLDASSELLNVAEIRKSLGEKDIELLDFHAWKTGPSNLSCSMIVKSPKKHPIDFYRAILKKRNLHLIVQEI